MSRIFAYCRISASDQTTENQRRGIESADFKVKPRRVIEEHISGSAVTSERPGFNRLLTRPKCDDQLIVMKLDRLGCNAMNIKEIVGQLTKASIRAHCLALGGIDPTGPTEKIIMQVISAVVEFERDLLLEHIHSGTVRAHGVGKRSGRPPVLDEEQKQVIFERAKSGVSIDAITREFKTSW